MVYQYSNLSFASEAFGFAEMYGDEVDLLLEGLRG